MTKFITDIIKEVDFSKKPYVSLGESGNKIISDTIIISTGAQAKWLGIENENKFKGFGISACATCDGFLYKNKEVAVVFRRTIDRRRTNKRQLWTKDGSLF